MFHHDCPLVVKPASTPGRLIHKKTWRDSLLIDMLQFGVTIQATVPQRLVFPEGLMNYPVLSLLLFAVSKKRLIHGELRYSQHKYPDKIPTFISLHQLRNVSKWNLLLWHQGL
jgi:hypothetical protein